MPSYLYHCFSFARLFRCMLTVAVVVNDDSVVLAAVVSAPRTICWFEIENDRRNETGSLLRLSFKSRKNLEDAYAIQSDSKWDM